MYTTRECIYCTKARTLNFPPFRCHAATESFTQINVLRSPYRISWYRPTALTLLSWEDNRRPRGLTGESNGELSLDLPVSCILRRPEISTRPYGPWDCMGVLYLGNGYTRQLYS